MSLPGLVRVIADDPQLKRALEEADAPLSPGADLLAPSALRPFLAAALAGAGDQAARTGAGPAGTDLARADGVGADGDAARRFVLAVTATAREAEELTAALGSLLPRSAAAYFPPWE